MLKGAKLLVLSFVILLPIGSSFYKYYYIKDYTYLVEAKCDPQTEVCFSRDCSVPDGCPPNGLSFYKQFFIQAYDFKKCSENSCESECRKKLLKCTPIPCGESSDDVCTTQPV